LTTRRNLILGGAAVAALAGVAGAWRLGGWLTPVPTYQALADLPPFRELATQGAISGAGSAMVGLATGTQNDQADMPDHVADVRANLCAALFGQWTPGPVPIAFFTDVNCPNCRLMEAVIAEIAQDTPGRFRLIRHEYPLLGPTSEMAARAMLAAEKQGGAELLQARFSRSRMVTDDDYIRAIASQLGLDADRLISDMASPAVTQRLMTSKAVGKVFGFYGTPNTLVGRTLVIGAVPKAQLQAIIADESVLPIPECPKV